MFGDPDIAVDVEPFGPAMRPHFETVSTVVGRRSLVKVGNTLIRRAGFFAVMVRASWNGMVLADSSSDRTVLVESKRYFPTPSPLALLCLLARKIEDRVALWNRVVVQEVDGS